MPRPTAPFAEVMAAVRRQRPGLVGISCLVNLLLLVTAIYMLQIYDRVLSSGSLDTLLWLTVVALFAIAIYGVLEQARRLILTRSAGFIDSELNAPVLRRVMDRRLAGAEPEAGVRDVTDLRAFYKSDAALAFLDAPWSLIFIAFVWALHPALGVITTAGAVVLFGATLANDLMTRQRQKQAAAVRAANEAAVRYVEGGETIGPLGMAPAVFARWRQRQDQARAEQQELGEKTTTILSLTRSIRLALQVLILGVGAFYVLEGQITAGVMIAASIIAARALAPLERLTAAWNRFVAARAAERNLARLFEGLEREPDPVRLPRPAGWLSVEGVSCLAPKTGEPILRNVGFALAAGECCAVVGPSGAGKSTLCRLLVGAWKPTGGHVRLDGADVYQWASDDLGPHIGYLPQKVELFPGTVAENIARFGPIDSEAVVRAAELAGVHELVLRLPRGYETDVGPYADRISLGQRQRIGLARALFGDPALVVLDEPNSNLDEAGDKALVDALRHLKRLGRTVVIVSHRAEVLKSADSLLVLKDGAMVRFGECAELLKPVAHRQPAPAAVPGAPAAASGTAAPAGAGAAGGAGRKFRIAPPANLTTAAE
jgi:PrtD family type I secretion system ABC transporter